MKISTRGRYAVRVLIDLAEHGRGREAYIPLKDIAKRQEISLKYLETIMTELSKSGLVEGVHGKGGGYRLVREPEQYRLNEILKVTEGDLAPVACLEPSAPPCPRAADCRTLPVWQGFYKLTDEYFGGISLADIMVASTSGDYVI